MREKAYTSFVVHELGSHFAQQEVAHRNSMANEADINHCSRSCRNKTGKECQTAYTGLTNIFGQRFANSRTIAVRVYRFPLPKCLRLILV